MQHSRSAYLDLLQERGFIDNCTDREGLATELARGVVSAYIGFDCTAPSLHAGSLVQIMKLRWLQQCGHRPIVLMGGGTSRIGDPSGKDTARKILSLEEIEANMAGIRRVFSAYLRFGDGPSDAIMVNNADWLGELEYVRFLREYGRHFSINRMLTFDSVRSRLDENRPLSFLEFSYMVLQAYDFVELNRRHGCLLQLGGADQWGNIVNGIELGRRTEGSRLYGLTSPLLTTASGAKMGKTATGAVWLDGARCSPYEFWQYWRNVDDADVDRFLRLFTELPIAETERLAALRDAEINSAKEILATKVTALLHGTDAANRAATAAQRVFQEGAGDAELPTRELARAELADGIHLARLVCVAGLARSAKDAKRLIRSGGVRVAGETATDANRLITARSFDSGPILVSVGPKRRALVRLGP